ncbi:mechanosensitive ion channel family protein [Pseudoalteromonas sp. CNAT2-18]|uniref:mechanosensitive ion channel family protein n=1 Tax=Pseudoalteromonas sp. CNAT2-18 TaxID=2908887 RepID=UPI003FA6B0A9
MSIDLTTVILKAAERIAPPMPEPSWQALSEQFRQFLHNAWQMLPNLSLGLAVMILCCLLARPVAYLLIKPLHRFSQSRLVQLVMRRFISILIMLLGVYVFLRLAALTEFAVAVMSGTGLIGLILGFAFKDIAENFISSMLLSIQRPFKIDDVIEVDGRLGVVRKVTARATTLVDFDGNHIQIPNATVYKNVIKNFTANPKMRGHFIVGVGYDNNLRQAQQLALQCISSKTMVLSDPPPQVLIDNLGASTANLQIYFWVDSERFSVLKVASHLMREVVDTFTEQEISMPDDARERIIVNQPDASAETTHAQPQKAKPSTGASRHNQAVDDISSDAEDIREQAQKSREPEQGNNII